MNFEITYELFCKCCPSAVMPDEELFERIRDYIDDAEDYVTYLTAGLLDNESVISDTDTLVLKRAVSWAVRLICARAYAHAIPHLDLVLTSTGFGVVSNQNVAPASSERVLRLLDAVQRLEIRSYYRLIGEMRNVANWGDSQQAIDNFLTPTIWDPDLWSLYGGEVVREVKDPVREYRIALLQAETNVSNLISSKFFDEIALAVRHNCNDEKILKVLHLIQLLVMAMVKNDHSVENLKGSLLTFLEIHIEDYPTYANSTAYKANHFKPYENKQDDSTFFFG